MEFSKQDLLSFREELLFMEELNPSLSSVNNEIYNWKEKIKSEQHSIQDLLNYSKNCFLKTEENTRITVLFSLLKIIGNPRISKTESSVFAKNSSLHLGLHPLGTAILISKYRSTKGMISVDEALTIFKVYRN